MNLILIDPVVRGSRLHQTHYFIESLHGVYDKIFLVTRDDYLDGHFEELIDLKKVEVVSSGLDLNGTWIKSLNSSEFKHIVKSINDLCNSDPAKEFHLFFDAIDDYYTSLFWAKRSIRNPAIKKYFFMRYRNDFLLRGEATSKKDALKYFIQRKVLNGIIKRNDYLLLYDERYFEQEIGIQTSATKKAHVKFIPEPWEGNFGNIESTDARKRLNIPEDKFIIMTIGRQDERKGVRDLLRAIKIGHDEDILLHIVGKIDPTIENEFVKLVESVPASSVLHTNEFVSEEALPYYFASSDVVALPYTEFFKYTSGVLTRAIASRKPVISTQHGLIGYRNRKYGLGATFKSGDVKELRNCMESIKNSPNATSNEKLRESGKLENFKTYLRTIFKAT